MNNLDRSAPQGMRWPFSIVSSLIAYLSRRLRRRHGPPRSRPKVLVVVEGTNDIEFLRRISRILHRADSAVPDLAELEQQRQLVFMPMGGGDSASAFRFAGLGLPEVHLLDRDVPPVTADRHRVAAMVNCRPRCHAAVLSKRSLENYLHSAAIFEASGIRVVITDDENVPEVVARHAHEHREGSHPWDQLPPRSRKRLRDKAKKWLNAGAVEHMTPERVADRDSQGEIRSWLSTIAALACTKDRG